MIKVVEACAIRVGGTDLVQTIPRESDQSIRNRLLRRMNVVRRQSISCRGSLSLFFLLTQIAAEIFHRLQAWDDSGTRVRNQFLQVSGEDLLIVVCNLEEVVCFIVFGKPSAPNIALDVFQLLRRERCGLRWGDSVHGRQRYPKDRPNLSVAALRTECFFDPEIETFWGKAFALLYPLLLTSVTGPAVARA